jgi:hypothetical protein
MPNVSNFQIVSFTAAREPWAEFQKLAKSQSLSASAFLRFVIARELRRDKRTRAARFVLPGHKSRRAVLGAPEAE